MYKLKPNYKMKTFNSSFILMIVLSSLMATAQKADSVIVIYDNQKTVIPVPAFCSQTTIKMADSIQIIEIGVLRKRAGENFPGAKQPVYTNDKSEKARKQVKWLSQIEAGYIRGFSENSTRFITNYTDQNGTRINWVSDYQTGSINGFQIRVLLREGVTMLNEKISFNSGLKIGYRRSFSNAYYNSTEYDTTGNIINNVGQYYDFRVSSFLLTYEAGFAYHFQTFKLPAKIFIGNSLNYAIVGSKDVNIKERTSAYITSYTSILHPYIGAEIGKFGILISMDWNISDQSIVRNSTFYVNRTHTLTTALTYRLF